MPGKPWASLTQPPVLLLSHGTPLLTGEQSHIRDYWKLQGDKALEYGIKGIIIMVRLAKFLQPVPMVLMDVIIPRGPTGVFREGKFMSR